MADRPPSVDALARSLRGSGLPPPLLVDAARAALAAGRPEAAAGLAEELRAGWLQPVVNATGVLLHTNLGRAPHDASLPASYTNLELDLTTGKRGARSDHVGALLARAAGAEAALVVNNGAAAVLLVLAALAPGLGVAVSRGELIEIGGGFRLPDVMAQSGARLVEVGTTNRTRVADFAAVAGEVALLLKVHRSNFRMTGFVEDVGVADLAGLGPPVVVDLGSGLLDAACPWLPDGPPAWLRHEPAVRQTIGAGAALVVFSGDKLLGGPQAGIIAGAAELVARCSRHPLYRVVRPGGTVLGVLQQVVLHYLHRDGGALPFWRMAGADVDGLRRRAEGLGGGEVVACESITGGGTLPGVVIPSAGVAVAGDVTRELRAAAPKPIVARVVDGRTVLDLRTVDPDDDALVGAAVRALGSR
ncbi:MAG: L-seryl-tRNA(Sec) selenium transferase [Acidimicrobiia bacterium]|nr:L-seryl-tRNA(Sec) selenium transferase [Acidimicrobiia bacterium]